MSYLLNRSYNVDVLLDLESSEPCLPTLFGEKRQKYDNLAVTDNYNFCDRHTDIHTDRWTWQLYDQLGPEGQVGENANLNSNDSTL